MDTLLQDARYAVRTMVKSPSFAVLSIIVLALGIGANTAIFSVVNSLLLRPLPLNKPDDLVQIWGVSTKLNRPRIPASFPDYVDWRNQNKVFDSITAYADWSFNLTGTAEPERISSAIVSGDFFTTLGVSPILGQVFLADENPRIKNYTVILGERLWRRRFNSDPQVVGRTIELNGETFTIAGVVPYLTELPGLSKQTELFAPISHGVGFDNRRGHYLSAIARIKSGTTLQQAQADMEAISEGLARQYPEANADRGIRLVSLQHEIVGDYKLALLVLLGAVAFVLLIASTNVANMLLARAAGRQREIAIRTALGASRLRLVRQLLTESLMLSVIGGGLGLLLALWGIDLLLTFSPPDLPRAAEISINGRVLGFTLLVSVLTGIVFGFVPALQSSRPNVNEALKESNRSSIGSIGKRRLRSFLVAAEIALSLVLLIGAGLLIRSLQKLQTIDPGFNPENVLTMQLDLSGPNYTKAAPVIAFHDQVLERIRSISGVDSVSTRSYVPVAADASFAFLAFMIEGRASDPANRPVGYYNAVSPDFFRTLEIPLLKGRVFDEHDVRKATPVVIVNERLAQVFFPDGDAIGKRISLNDENPKEEDWTTIVGVVKDTKPRALDREAVPEFYMPFAQQPEASMSLMIRTSANPEAVAGSVRSVVVELDKDQPLYSIRTMSNILYDAVAAPRFRTLLLAAFASVALVLAVVGIYGVMSYAVSQRTREIGIRVALGARAVDVLKLIVGQGAMITIAGVALGNAGAWALTRIMSTLLFNVSPTDMLTFSIVSIILAGVALAACLVPARRALRTDPVVALRYE